MNGAEFGPPRIRHQRVEAAPVASLAALFDDGLPAPRPGESLPPLWHWVALAEWSGASGTGPDGHPHVGAHLLDVGKPRRMFAGGRVELLDDIRIDEQVRREDRILAVTPKTGSSGDFVLVRAETCLYDSTDRLAVREQQDLIYRDPPPPSDAPTEPGPAKPVVPALLQRSNDRWTFDTDPTKLLRFSSATSNGHRIHYDHPYATQVEGYPDLVVHGPLMTLAMAEVLRLEHRSATLFRHRAVQPLFCAQRADVEVEVGADRVATSLRTAQGVHATLLAGE